MAVAADAEAHYERAKELYRMGELDRDESKEKSCSGQQSKQLFSETT